MPVALQVKLLRVLLRAHGAAGGRWPRGAPVDVRILSATHRDLGLAIIDGSFRKDLYYRLNVVLALALPTLAGGARTSRCWPHFLARLALKYNLESTASRPTR